MIIKFELLYLPSYYDLIIRWIHVLSTDTPTIIRAQPERHALAVARIYRLSWLNG